MAAKKKTAPIRIPQDWAAANEDIGAYVELQSQLAAIEARAAKAVARINATAEEKAAPIRARMDALFEGIYLYGQANRARLTADGKTKTVTMTNGAFGWRLVPPSIAFDSKLKTKDIVVAVRDLVVRLNDDEDEERRKLKSVALQFLRPKVEIDKQAMIKHKELAAEVDGVRVVEGEEVFFIDPTVTELAEPV